MRKLLFPFLFPLVLLGAMVVSAWADDGAAPPKDAMWTITCKSFTGPYRVELAKRARETVSRLTKWKDWYVVHQEDESTLFYGFYKASPLRDVQGGDPKEAERAREDLRNIRSLRDTDNNPVFPFPYPTEIPRPGSEGPPEWDIKNTPTDRYWSILIGEYRDNPERKKAAVEAVKVLRAEGTEAYYLHGPVTSGVCVGAWPKKALKEQEGDVAAEPTDPKAIIKVYNVPLPKNAVTDYYDTEGKHYRVFAPKVEILDPSMRAAVDRNPYFFTNGESLAKRVKDPNGKERLVPDPSLLLIIPHKETTFGSGGNNADAQAPIPPRPLAPPTPPPAAKPKDPTPGTGKLKSLD